MASQSLPVACRLRGRCVHRPGSSDATAKPSQPGDNGSIKKRPQLAESDNTKTKV